MSPDTAPELVSVAETLWTGVARAQLGSAFMMAGAPTIDPVDHRR